MKNWKTSLIGIGSAIALGAGQLLSTGNLNWRDYLTMAFMAALGTFAKDMNVTGGTIVQGALR